MAVGLFLFGMIIGIPIVLIGAFIAGAVAGTIEGIRDMIRSRKN